MAKEKKKEIAVSLFKKRWRKFKTLKRGYYCFLIITFLFILSFFLPLFVGRNALLVKYEGQYFTPVFSFHAASTFNQKDVNGEANYRLLDKQFEEEDGDNWVLLPLY